MEDKFNEVTEVVAKTGNSSNILVPALVAGGVSLAVMAGSKMLEKVFSNKEKTEETIVVKDTDN